MSALYKWILIDEVTKESFQLTAPHPDPEGWADMALKLYRSEKHGVFLEPSAKQFGFYADGGGQEFIEQMRSTYDVNAQLSIICMHRPNSGVEFVKLFQHRLDMLSYSKEKRIVYLSIEQSDLYSKVEARMDVNVDVESTTSIGGSTITAPATETITLPGQMLRLTSEWKVASGYNVTTTAAYTYPQYTNSFFTPLGELTKSELAISTPLSEIQQHDETLLAGINNLDNNIPPILRLASAGFDTPITIHYHAVFSGTFDNNQTVVGQNREVNDVKLQIWYGKRTDPVNAMNVIDLWKWSDHYSSPSGYGDLSLQAFDVDETGTFTINPGDEVYLIWFLDCTLITGGCTIWQRFDYDESTLTFYADTNLAATPCKTILVHEAFNAVVDAMADSDGNFYSEFYGRTDSDKITYAADGEGAYKAIARGETIRKRDVPITLNFNELYQSADALDNIGMGIVDGKIRVEPYHYFYNYLKKIIRLENIREIKTEIGTSYYFNQVKLGYKKYETEINGGLDEPNTSTEWSNNIHFIANRYVRESPYIGSSYAIETTRRKNIDLTTEDWRFDADNFWICLNSDKTVEQKADAFDSGTGMLAIDTAYNLRITPARMLLAHFRSIVAGLQTIHGNLNFVAKAGNRDLAMAKTDNGFQIDYSGATLTETDSLAYNDANAEKSVPIITPLVDSFETSITFQDFMTIRDSFITDTTDAYGYIEYYETPDDIRRGFVLEMNYKLLNGKTTFKILRRNINTLS